ncbi:MAG: hypothetical protein KatS3mg115_0692 [Candidatus Poribacteria bacterium]|nr:MAG: hypothetical protein KatS3mg115_0692 [Candidatus Poribacteria bacterium]
MDVVVETVGASTWEISCRSAAKNGRIVTCGVTAGAEALTPIRHLYQHQISILGAVMGGPAELRSILNLVLLGKLQPVVDRVLPLSAIAEAHRALESREQYGKIVLRIGE